MRRGEQETANPKQTANITESIKENIQDTIHQEKLNNITAALASLSSSPSTHGREPAVSDLWELIRVRSKEAEAEDFWERFEAKCIQYNFADTVFRYLVMVRYYYGAPLPDYLYSKYSPLTSVNGRTGSEGEKDFIRFENFLAGTGNEFIGRGAPKSATATHILHLKQLKSPGDILRYVKGVVFPGKTFMIDKYSIKRPRLFWLWYPYRWWVALRAVVGLRR